MIDMNKHYLHDTLYRTQDRKVKKLFNNQENIKIINSGLRNLGLTYNVSKNYLMKNNIILNNKMLQELVLQEVKIFQKLFIHDKITNNK